MTRLFLGIDVGTSRIKALLFDHDEATVVAGVAVPTPQHEVAGIAFHSPAAVRAAVMDVAARTLAEAGAARRGGVAGISITSVGEEAVLLDAAQEPVGEVPTWFAGAGVPFAAEHAAELEQRAPIAGLRHPEYTVHTLAWWARRRAHQARTAVTLTDLGSWLLSTLGPGRLVMDHSHASRTGMFDAPTRSWRPAALHVIGLPHLALPELAPSGEVVGQLGAEAAAELGVTPGTPLVAGGHDHFCGALASGARSPGDLFISAGTSEAHLLVTDALDPQVVDRSEVGCFVTDGLFYLHAALPSGSLFQTLTRMLGVDPDGPLDAIVGAEPIGSRGVRARIGPDRRLSLSDIPTDATAATVLRAFLEGTALASADLFHHLAATAGRPVEHRLLAGAPVTSAAWREMRTAIGDTPADFVDAAETTALGAAHLAARAVTGALPPAAAWRRAEPPVSPARQREYVSQLGPSRRAEPLPDRGSP